MTLMRRFREWRRYMNTVRELDSLSNRELEDVGLTRDQISRYARDAHQL